MDKPKKGRNPMNKRFQKYALIIFGSLAAWCLAGKLQYIQNGYYSLVGSAEIVLVAPLLYLLFRATFRIKNEKE